MANIEQGIKNQMPKLNKDQLSNQAIVISESAIKGGYLKRFNSGSDAASYLINFINYFQDKLVNAFDKPIKKKSLELTKLALENRVFDIPETHADDYIYLATHIFSFVSYIDERL